MCKENIDYKRLCDAIGITEGIDKELARDIHYKNILLIIFNIMFLFKNYDL